MNSVERVTYYSENVAEETGKHSSDGGTQDSERFAEERQKYPMWPSKGQMDVRSLSMRYRENLPLVLNDLSFSVKGGEHIGVVGRTGAGKSSLMNVFFRIMEFEGQVIIDGVDTKEISLDLLRSRLTIISQEAVMFSTTVRENLDPFGAYEDHEIWDALEKAEMKSHVEGMEGQLSAPVAERGSNFSVGQRQLICIARAILRKPKLLFLDEATASIDQETDELIQQTLRKTFKDITIITIAHRINTIIDSDRILVIDEGKMVEFDQPGALLAQKDSAFSALVDNMGKNMAEKMRHMVGLNDVTNVEDVQLPD